MSALKKDTSVADIRAQFLENHLRIFTNMVFDVLRELIKRLDTRNLSLQQYIVLRFLATVEHAKMAELSCLMEHTTPATTGVVDRLMREGMVKRLHDENDRRQVLVKATPKGCALVNELRHDITQATREVMQTLSLEDIAAWNRINEAINLFIIRKKRKHSHNKNASRSKG
jgi:DNA-binding MarR family transcriptional regulator